MREPWVGPSVDPLYSRVAGWPPDDVLELQNVDDNAAMVVGRRRKVSTAGAVDLPAVS